jgi:hypothetical protein
MRNFMDITKLLEHPAWISGSTDFGLGDDENNHKLTQIALDRLANGGGNVIKETGEYVLFEVPYGTDGKIYLINKTKERIHYYVQFETVRWKVTGEAVTQVAVWRSAFVGAYFQNLTKTMFFDYLLPRKGTIISDEQQTGDGHRFWMTVMSMAAQRGLNVAFVDFRGNKVEQFEPGTDLESWITSKNAWGSGDKFRDRRFMIKAA